MATAIQPHSSFGNAVHSPPAPQQIDRFADGPLRSKSAHNDEWLGRANQEWPRNHG